MQTSTYRIAPRIYRLSTCVAEAAPGGFTFNHFLIDADEPMRRLDMLKPQTLAIMHGASKRKHCAEALTALADANGAMRNHK